MKRVLYTIFTLVMIFSLIIITGCKSDTPAEVQNSDSESSDAAPLAELPDNIETEPIPETEEETTIEEITEKKEDVTEEVTSDEITAPPETTAPETTAAETTKEAETTAEKSSETPQPPVKPVNKYVNPLTGIKGSVDMSSKRPVAIMINNLRASLPQVGISNADVLYECLVEGGTTRLLMVVMNYEDIPVIGSVRSSREYYLDFASNHDAIYIHAGGSNEAYNQIQSRKVNNLDGVNMHVPNMFYRDEERRKTMSIEHTLMTSGKGIVGGIDYMKYRTNIKDGFASPFNFADEGKVISYTGAKEAKHVLIPYNGAQFPQYIYQSKTKTYLRYQFNGIEHIDGATGAQLEFTNLILLVCPHANTGDDKGHIDVDTTGSGKGYYVSGGKYIEIKWSKPTQDTPITLTLADGKTPLTMNRGKTAVNIISSNVDSQLVLNYGS